MLINFDNAATSFPKPQTVRAAAITALDQYGGNAGRGGHPLSMRTSKAVFDARETVADFFHAEPDQVVFTLNCTHALNLAIQGILCDGGHVITSDLEHNSVSRPIVALHQAGKIRYSIAHVDENDHKTVRNFAALIQPDTKAIVCTIASNVTGQILPWKDIAALCRARNICFIADGAQACGILPVHLTDGINILCTAGHKSLFGTTGTGILITDGIFPIKPLMQGGTGSNSQNPYQPDFLPDALESGTLNTLGVISLKAGIDYINQLTLPRIHQHEEQLCQRFMLEMRQFPEVTCYRKPNANYAPIVSFNVKDRLPEQLADYLSQFGFCLRAGFHCAPLAHQSLGTADGTIRFAPSIFSREAEVVMLAKRIKIFLENPPRSLEIEP